MRALTSEGEGEPTVRTIVAVSPPGMDPRDTVNTTEAHQYEFHVEGQTRLPSSVAHSIRAVVLPFLSASSCSWFALVLSFTRPMRTRPSLSRISNAHTAARSGCGKKYLALEVEVAAGLKNTCWIVTRADTKIASEVSDRRERSTIQ